MMMTVPLLASVFGTLYHQEIGTLVGMAPSESALRSGFLKAYMALLVIVPARQRGGWYWHTRAGRSRRKNPIARRTC